MLADAKRYQRDKLRRTLAVTIDGLDAILDDTRAVVTTEPQHCALIHARNILHSILKKEDHRHDQ